MPENEREKTQAEKDKELGGKIAEIIAILTALLFVLYLISSYIWPQTCDECMAECKEKAQSGERSLFGVNEDFNLCTDGCAANSCGN